MLLDRCFMGTFTCRALRLSCKLGTVTSRAPFFLNMSMMNLQALNTQTAQSLVYVCVCLFVCMFLCVSSLDLLVRHHEVLKDVVHDQDVRVLQQDVLCADVSVENLQEFLQIIKCFHTYNISHNSSLHSG